MGIVLPWVVLMGLAGIITQQDPVNRDRHSALPGARQIAAADARSAAPDPPLIKWFQTDTFWFISPKKKAPMDERPHYSTWIRVNRIVIFWVLAIIFLGVGFATIAKLWFLISFVPGLLFAYIAFIITMTHLRFSEAGGDFQNRIHELLLSHKVAGGETVDIGCGNGSLVIKSAKGDRTSHHVGIDYWGNNWEYSLEQCQTNARLEGVDNVEFVKGTAARTEFADGRFSCVLSCLTFHEVRDESNKLNVLKEALRILKPNGCYVFLDLFEDTKYYPSVDDVRLAVERSGCSVTVDKRLSELIALPYPLNGKRALRFARLLCGTKRPRVDDGHLAIRRTSPSEPCSFGLKFRQPQIAPEGRYGA